MDYPVYITNIWNATIEDDSDGRYKIKNASWNANIKPGRSAEYGFTVKGDFGGFPKCFTMLGMKTVDYEQGYTVEYFIDEEWKTGFLARILITNISDKPIEDWSLSFLYDREITSIWTASIESHEGNQYMVKNKPYNSIIQPGKSVAFGFKGRNGRPVDEPSDYRLMSASLSMDEHEEKIDIEKDTDEDGLSDLYELANDLDPDNPDTDGDGLSDGFEVLYASSNPLSIYTLENGVPDSELDPDGDGLDLLTEYEHGSDPLSQDSDWDGLKDNEEVLEYHTDPASADSDNDGVPDGEEIKCGLDPLNTSTYGYQDYDYAHSTVLGVDFDTKSVVANNDVYDLGIELHGHGNLTKGVYVRESAFDKALESEFAIDPMTEILYTGNGEIDGVTISFKIKEGYIFEDCPNEDLEGIRRYSIFYYDENNRVLIPVASEYNMEDNTITSRNADVGTYVLIDMEKWLEHLGYEISDDAITEVNEIENAYSEYVYEGEVLSLNDQDIGIEGDTIQDTDFVGSPDEEVPLSDEAYDEDVRILENDPAGEDDFVEAQGMENETRMLESNSDTPRLWDDSINTPEHIVPGNMAVDIVFCINNNIDIINETEFESIKSNLLLIGDTVFTANRHARIYIIDQNGNIVKGVSDMEYAMTKANLEIMLDKVKNIPPQERYIEPQLHTLVLDIPFRETAYRAAYFFGNAYRTFESELYSYDIARINVRCIINNPYTGSGSWYDILSQRTKGLLLYNYVDFADDVITFMYGNTDVYGRQNYNMISSVGMKKISLEDRLNLHSNIDTDGDSLRDWSEIDTECITVDRNGNAILPSYYEYLILYDKDSYVKWERQYAHLRDRNGRNLDDMLSEVLVLPVLSDPTMKDSDGDGISDYIERTQNVIDERYECLGAFHKDTIETIYPELSDAHINNTNYATYISVKGNEVILHAKVAFTGDVDVRANTVLNTNATEQNTIDEINAIVGRIGFDPTLKELVVDGIKTRWEGEYKGTQFDFCEGLNVDFSIEIKEVPDVWLTYKILFDIKSNICGFSNVDILLWSIDSTKNVTMYTSDCRDKSHIGKNGTNCQNYLNNLYNIVSFEGTAAHEFGHVIGLYDLYPEADFNHGYTIISNSEVEYSLNSLGSPHGGAIMRYSGRALANDIEMVLLAFSENQWQFYVPYGTDQKISKAIKSGVRFTDDIKADSSNVSSSSYQWDDITHSFIIN